jgi:hypothetical protein
MLWLLLMGYPDSGGEGCGGGARELARCPLEGGGEGMEGLCWTRGLHVGLRLFGLAHGTQ